MTFTLIAQNGKQVIPLSPLINTEATKILFHGRVYQGGTTL